MAEVSNQQQPQEKAEAASKLDAAQKLGDTAGEKKPDKKVADVIVETGYEIEEKAENITGWFYDNFIIIAPIDDSIKRPYTMYSLYNIEVPADTSFVYIPQPASSYRAFAEIAMNSTLTVLKKVTGRSKHFPRLIYNGIIKKLVFGADAQNEEERDPEWTNRPFIIISHEHALLSSLLPLSENGCLPVDLALHVGLGMAYCLAALHRAGFIHRYVTPHSFSYPVPLTLDVLSSRMIITDLSICLDYPYKNRSNPRVKVSFIGCDRYATIRAHDLREQGPADDYISLIYVIAEMINGKLPWRSVYDRKLIAEMKREYPTTQDFKRLPKEIRQLYREMILKKMANVDDAKVVNAFKNTILRRDPTKSFELPKWLAMPSAN